MENKRYFLLGILALGCVQGAFGMESVGGGNQPNNNQPNGNQSNSQMLPLAFNAPQKITTLQDEAVSLFTVNLVHGCIVKITVSSVATSSTLQSVGSVGATQSLPLVVNEVVNHQLIAPPGTSLNQIIEAIAQFSRKTINGLPAGISVPQIAWSLLQLIGSNPLLQN